MTERRDGTRRLYRARPEGLRDVRTFLEDFWDDGLERLRDGRRTRPTTGRRPPTRRRLMAQLEREIMIDATPETIFPLLTTTEGMLRWEGTEGEIDARPGGVYRILAAGAHLGVGEFVEVVPNEKVRFTFGWDQPGNPITPGSTEVEITLHPEGSKTLVRLVHRGLPDDAVVRPHPGLGPLPRAPGRGGRRRRPRARRHAAGLTPASPYGGSSSAAHGRRRGRRLGGRRLVVVVVEPGTVVEVTGSSVPAVGGGSWRSTTSRSSTRRSWWCCRSDRDAAGPRGGSGKSSTSRPSIATRHVALPDLGREAAAGHAVHRRWAPGGPPTPPRRSRARSRRTRRRRCPAWCRSCRRPGGRCPRPDRCPTRSRRGAPR